MKSSHQSPLCQKNSQCKVFKHSEKHVNVGYFLSPRNTQWSFSWREDKIKYCKEPCSIYTLCDKCTWAALVLLEPASVPTGWAEAAVVCCREQTCQDDLHDSQALHTATQLL
ncbi:hypothetical protein O3G_MSEX003983 [Manduca sexta]|uniref:Uncharacterized protein n=1 Tax=Manduca sexta TaxID=7130 RepID=A0A921YVY5_MANSE|nr:hypothetical protein O3G_MSEX003983 [Manduca sexta]